MQQNLSSVQAIGSSVKYPRSDKGGFIGFVRAFFLSRKIAKMKKKQNLPPEPPYGIRMYVGLPGSGKTISMVEYLNTCKRIYPGIKIFSNFGYKYEDAPIHKMEEFVKLDSKQGVIFAVDEVQLSFQSRSFNNFPPEMIFLLTQNRKYRKHFVCTAQLFEHVDKIFRDLTNEVVDCRGWFDLYFTQKAYTGIEYRRQLLPTFLEPEKKKRTMTLWNHSFVANQELFDCYDTLRIVQHFVRPEDEKNADWRQNRPLPEPTYTPVPVKVP